MGTAFFLLFAITTGVITYVLIYNRIKQQPQSIEKEPPVRDVESSSQVQVKDTQTEVTWPPVEEYPEPTSHEQDEEQLSDGLLLSLDNEEDELLSCDEEILAVPQESPRSKRTKRQRLEPGKRGGRPRLPIQTSKAKSSNKRESLGIKPEIVCWQRERKWWLGVEVPIPDEHLEIACMEVVQEGAPLSQDNYQEGCWRLEKVIGDVFVQWNGEEQVISLRNGNYLLFKIYNQDYGRRVKAPSTGSYLMVVPSDWVRDEELSGPPPVEPEPVVIHGYQAHYFYLGKNDKRKIAFHVPGEKPVIIKPKTPRFELIGNRIEDAREDIGPLFGEQPPQIRTTNSSEWNDVSAIVVGEEGRGKNKWRTSFSPDHEQTQDIPTEVASRKGGWYFLRFYDHNDELIESLDFRFLAGL
ncbi:MAG TPA: hypothetical protein VNJ09_10630, partial [Chthonomonadales bacterium]|nr:hypothetical protein [Chthonomonadales bacterium]